MQHLRAVVILSQHSDNQSEAAQLHHLLLVRVALPQLLEKPQGARCHDDVLRLALLGAVADRPEDVEDVLEAARLLHLLADVVL